MFESLDDGVLQKLAGLENKETLKKTVRLEEVMECLEQAVKECTDRTTSDSADGARFEQAAIGIQASQQIIEKWWEAS